MSETHVTGLEGATRTRIYEHVFAHDDHEVGGVLVGSLGNGTMPIVTGMIAALEADGQRTSLTFTHEAWATIHATMDAQFAGKQIVGWYHSHPGFGIFLSTYDRFIHENFFADPRQIAYVVDPHAGTEGVFHWNDGELELLWEGPSGRSGTGARIRQEVREEGPEQWDSAPRDSAPPDSARRNLAAGPALTGHSASIQQRRLAAVIVSALVVVLIAAVVLTPSTSASGNFGHERRHAVSAASHGNRQTLTRTAIIVTVNGP